MHVVTFKWLPNHVCLLPTLLIKYFKTLSKSYPIIYLRVHINISQELQTFLSCSSALLSLSHGLHFPWSHNGSSPLMLTFWWITSQVIWYLQNISQYIEIKICMYEYICVHVCMYVCMCGFFFLVCLF